jgi:DNA polymerase III subunit gamma/tau
VSLALYRKYRSHDFASVIGQRHVVDTLATALKGGQISHAYLFTGPRGVGKTTVARLLARSLNCLEVDSAARPCNQCGSCEVPIESHLDLIEIDAASNRRIDEIRELREKINLAPAVGRFKVYIIDEVHMLTTEAFNALLKTLEEPPSHAVFILATTEAHKLPETIISRTQRFSFKLLGIDEIVTGLGLIAKQEKINIDRPALEQLAMAAGGSMRDAVSMLDQVASGGRADIGVETVRKILGWGENESIREIALALAAGDPAAALGALDKAIEGGAAVSQLIVQLVDCWRQVLLGMVGVRQGEDDLLVAAKERLSLIQTVTILETLMAAGKSRWPNLALEAALVKLALVGQAETVTSQPKLRPAEIETPVAPAADEPSLQLAAGDEWNKALQIIKTRNNSLYALLMSCGTAFDGGELLITCRFNFHRDRLEESKNRQVIEAALKQAFRRSMGVRTIIEDKSAEKVSTESELVSSALEILGGEVIDE